MIHFLDLPSPLAQVQQNETTCLCEKGFLYFLTRFYGPGDKGSDLANCLSSIT